MRTVILYIAASLDGFIAGPQDELDWLPSPTENDYGMSVLIAQIDTILMGRRTYEISLGFGEDPNANPDLTSYIFTQHPDEVAALGIPPKGAVIVKEDPVLFVKALKNKTGRDIWLLGGGQLIKPLLAAGLVDELRLFLIPMILGDGIPLFPTSGVRQNYKLTGSETYPNSMVSLTYHLGQ